MDEGASAFARNQYGDLDYAQLGAVPISSDAEWWNAPGVGRLVEKARAARGKTTLWLGYPMRLGKARTKSWEGFFVEPVLIWPIELPTTNDEAPSIDESMPLVNPKFLRNVAMGGRMQLAQEAAKLSDELGLSVPADELPQVDELVERLRRIRPDWDWQEGLDPADCSASSSLSHLSKPGIYNRAVIIAGERTPYTRGLETELKALAEMPPARLKGTALGRWLAADPTTAASSMEAGPLIEVLPMNTEQRAAVQAALTAPHTVITGPPGTGKSQVVTNILVNAAWRGMKVLFASKNNKAVDVVEARVNGLGNRPVLLRLGSKDYQGSLADYLTKLLAGEPGPEVRESYTDALERQRGLEARLAELNMAQQTTLQCRNIVDGLDTELVEARQLFGVGFPALTNDLRDRATEVYQSLGAAVDAADRDRQGWLARTCWGIIRARRLERLARASNGAAGTLRELHMSWPEWSEAYGIGLLRANLQELHRRSEMVHKALTYKKALRTLQRLPSFESIAQQRAMVTDQLGQASGRLWRDWVQLAPTRLTAVQRREVAEHPAALQLLTGPDARRVHPAVRERARALQARVAGLFPCWAVTSLSARGRIPMEPGYFDLVVIDEASQCDIASALPLLFRAKRTTIIGDPMQLRHISALSRPRDSELQHKHGLVDTRLGWMYSVNSLFDLAASTASADSIINLRDHHRSHADIIGFSNAAFYDGRLRVATRYPQLKRPRAAQPGVVWEDVSGEVVRPREGGAQNEAEARAVVAALVDLLLTRGYAGSVGVVTPFRAQAQLLQRLIKLRPELEGVVTGAELLVDTVHKFQGDERDVMFFSPVVSRGMSKSALGFLQSNGNLFNVAITRARGLLHVVGDRGAIMGCGVEYLEKFASYVDTLDSPRRETPQHSSLSVTAEYPMVPHPERVSEWEHVLYRAMVASGLKPIPQFRVQQYDLDFALFAGQRMLAIEVDGERYHRTWTGELCQRDQLRNMRLIELGWEVQRFWVYEVRDELERCIERLKRWAERRNDLPAGSRVA